VKPSGGSFEGNLDGRTLVGQDSVVPFHAQSSVVSSIRSSRHGPIDSHIIAALITHNHIGLAITFLSVDKNPALVIGQFRLETATSAYATHSGADGGYLVAASQRVQPGLYT
jgi:hypothetical protein